MAFSKINYKNQTLVINTIGGGIAEYYLNNNGKREEIIYGYSKQEDRDGGMGDVLSPFPGRVDMGKYTFEGVKYQIRGVKMKDGHPLHGFLRDQRWKVIKSTNNSTTMGFKVYQNKYRKRGYPFSLDYKITYKLSNRGLTVIVEVKNIGNKTAPFGIGFHPYFSVAGKVDDIIWQVPAKKLVEFDQRLKPTGKLLDIKNTNLDFRKPKKIGNRIVDNCFFDLEYDLDGRFRSTLENRQNKIKITIWQDKNFPYFQTYSADTIDKVNYRKAIALEPQTCSGFAFNLPSLGLISLKPKTKFVGRWGVEIN